MFELLFFAVDLPVFTLELSVLAFENQDFKRSVLRLPEALHPGNLFTREISSPGKSLHPGGALRNRKKSAPGAFSYSEPAVGFEPTTPGLQNRSSAIELR